MIDLAERDGVKIDVPKLASLLGVPVVPTRATRKAGRDGLIAKIDEILKTMPPPAPAHRAMPDLRTLQTRSAPHRRRDHDRAGDEQADPRRSTPCCCIPWQASSS